MPGHKAGEGRIEWRYERIFESKPARLPTGAALAASPSFDLRPGPCRAGPSRAGAPGRGTVRALGGAAAPAVPCRGALPPPGRAPAPAASNPRSAADSAQQKAARKRRPRHAAAPQDHELSGAEIGAYAGFLATMRYRWVVPSIRPSRSIVSCSCRSLSKHRSTENPGNSHSMMRANHTKAPTS